ncbi:hypothetical protein Tco_0983786 [Tanacetum coccineum]
MVVMMNTYGKRRRCSGGYPCDYILEMNPDKIDKNDPNDVQLQNKDIMYDIASSVEIQKVYEFKRVFDRLNDDDAIDLSHKDAQVTLGDTNDPFSSISMSKDFADCHTPKQGLDGIRVRGRDFIIYITQDTKNGH